MSKNEGEVHCNDNDIQSSEEIIEEIIESSKKLQINSEKKTEQSPENDSEEKAEQSPENEAIHDDYIDEIYLKDLDVLCSPEELETRKKLSVEGKDFGNSLFKEGKYECASKKYTEALRTCPLDFKEDRAILYANRAAAKLKQDLKKEAIQDCTKALELNPKYIKPYLRRAKLLEEDDKLDEALEDYKKIVELDPENKEAKFAVMRLPSQITERNERLKREMLSSLKELGNKILKPFGLSTANFQVQQDPNSGGYSINFTQNRK